MEITRLRIHNYRSIKDLNVACDSNVILLGENNSGKSNILSAIEFALSSSAKPEPEDLFAFHDDGDDSLWVELTFAKLTEQEKRTFAKYLRHDGTVCLRKTATWDQSGKVGTQYNGYVEEPVEAWLQADNAANYTRRDEAAKTPLMQYLPEGRLSKAHVEEAQRKCIEAHASETQFEERLEAGPLLGQKTVAAGVLPDYYHVPAIRDLDDEAKFKSTTMFGKLMSRTLEEMAANDQRFMQVRSDLDTLVKSLNKSDANNDRPRQLTVLEDNDLDHYKDIVIASKSSSRAGTSIRQCQQELFDGPDVDDRKKRFHMAYWINPDRGEMFFAKKVVLVEGETEKTLLPYLAQRLDCYDPTVSIIDCGSKHNLPLYIIIANAFKLNFHVVHDEDSLPDSIPDDWDEDKRKEKRRTFALNSEIAALVRSSGKVSICPGDLETLSGVSKTQGKKKGKALAALEHFQALDKSEIPAGLVELVMDVYTTDRASSPPSSS